MAHGKQQLNVKEIRALDTEVVATRTTDEFRFHELC